MENGSCNLRAECKECQKKETIIAKYERLAALYRKKLSKDQQKLTINSQLSEERLLQKMIEEEK